MKKIDTLRDAIIAATPELAQQPARLRMWVDRGTVEARQTDSGSFAYPFRLNAVIMELATDVSVIFDAIIRWLRVNQPDRLAPGKTAFTFDVDILDNRTVDVLIEVELTQCVQVAPNEGGGYTLTDIDEPNPLFGDALGLGGAAPVPPLSGIQLGGQDVEL